MWSIGGGNDEALQCSCWEPHEPFKNSKPYDTEKSPPSWKTIGEEQWVIKLLNQGGNHTQLWMCLVIKITSDAKEQYCTWTWNVRSTSQGQLGMVKQEWTIGNGESKHEHIYLQFSSVAQVSDSLPPHVLQHTRLPWQLPMPRTCSNSCPSSQWCHPTMLSSIPSPLFPRHLRNHWIKVDRNEGI